MLLSKKTVALTTLLTLTALVAPGRFAQEGYAQTTETRPTFAVSPYVPNLTHNGPISSVAVSSDDRTIVVASESGGAFRSTDAGRSWQHEDGLPSSRVEDVEYLTSVAGSACPCWIATTAQNFEASGGGGIFIRYIGSPSWTRIPQTQVFPASGSRCPANPSAHEISVAPNGRDIFVATDCGIAAGSAPGAFRPVDIGASTSPGVVSVVALDDRRVIAGGPSGVWYTADVTATTPVWALGSGVGTLKPQDIHSLGADPRGENRAYVVDRAGDPFRTSDGGATWQAIAAPTRDPNLPCGGIGHMRMVLQGTTLRLYLGNECDTKTATVNPTDESVSSWSLLTVDHSDTRHIAFHSGTKEAWLIGSDGGLHESTDGTRFTYIGGLVPGLNADQVTEVVGQYLPGERYPEVTFATWHNDLWAIPPSAPGATPRPVGRDGAEGFGLFIPRRITGTATNRLTYVACWGCTTKVSQRRFVDPQPWTGPPAATNGGIPILIAPGRYAQPTIPTNGPWSYWYNGSMGTGPWQQVVTYPAGRNLSGVPLVVGPAANPSIVQPVAVGVFPGGQIQEHLSRIENFTGTGTPTLTFPLMNNFGSLGVMPANTPTYDVLGVDPESPARMIAPDVTNGDVRISIDGGDTWFPIAGLTGMVTQSGALQFSRPFGMRMASIVSTVSFCPDNGSRVLIGTRQGGAYFSFDGGFKWSRVSGSGPITDATSVFWLEGCGSALMSTFGRGIYRLDMGLRTQVLQDPRECTTEICRLVDRVRHAVDKARALDAPGIIVSDGWIRNIKDKGKVTVVTVTPGAVVTKFLRKPEGVRIEEADRLGNGGRVLQAAFFLDGEVVASADGRKALRLFPPENEKVGEGSPEPKVDALAGIWLDADPTLTGEPFLVDAAGPLIVRGVAEESIADPMELTVDGEVVATFDPGTKSIEYIDDKTVWSLRPHTVVLSLRKGDESFAIASTWFMVPNSDEEKEGPEEGR